MSGTRKITAFREEEEDWASFFEWLECYLQGRKSRKKLKVHMLIMGLCAHQYRVLKDLVASITPSSMSYADRQWQIERQHIFLRNHKFDWH